MMFHICMKIGCSTLFEDVLPTLEQWCTLHCSMLFDVVRGFINIQLVQSTNEVLSQCNFLCL